MAIAGNVSPQWLEQHYRLWREHPEQLSPDWRAFFEGFDLARELPGTDYELAVKTSAVDSLIYRYRDLGHRQAWTNPLDEEPPAPLPDLMLAAFGLDETDLERTFRPLRYPGQAPLHEIIASLRATYCGSIGVEFMHIQEPNQRQWLKERMETTRNRALFSRDERLAMLTKLQEATLFEQFLHRRFLGQKRFSLEGGEALIPLLDALVTQAASAGVNIVCASRSRSTSSPSARRSASVARIVRTIDDGIDSIFPSTRGRLYSGSRNHAAKNARQYRATAGSPPSRHCRFTGA